ncbi:MAG: hypothetical protein A2X42_11095 [Candidatus Margulisbacteria bacterium GWF2_38_17]|nr:MAG: hypothetical protein A2X43_04405 [Candidatus Margulisbacteria bacterium GWD2_39_127]OGI04049.1 MAG: hypothetical protein A2X42_11095 [Candidatus Margulisbacteria bacterium GWF2_38_17]OGI05992.1 MAG: hypothetical protein A2X41_12270 [Candidatus Margulisbacteria bacterium GWE2_39_32]
MFPLVMLNVGELAQVSEVFYRQTGDDVYLERLESMGIRSGREISVVTNNRNGPLVVLVGNSRIALARNIAKKIMVRRI